jgi:hypothetical protein
MVTSHAAIAGSQAASRYLALLKPPGRPREKLQDLSLYTS